MASRWVLTLQGAGARSHPTTAAPSGHPSRWSLRGNDARKLERFYQFRQQNRQSIYGLLCIIACSLPRLRLKRQNSCGPPNTNASTVFIASIRFFVLRFLVGVYFCTFHTKPFRPPTCLCSSRDTNMVTSVSTTTTGARRARTVSRQASYKGQLSRHDTTRHDPLCTCSGVCVCVCVFFSLFSLSESVCVPCLSLSTSNSTSTSTALSLVNANRMDSRPCYGYNGVDPCL